MNISFKGAVVGALALAGATLAAADAQAMPVGPVAAPAAAEAHLDQVYYYGYGYRRPFVRRFFYGYRPFYGYRRFGYYGYRRPFYGYGFRRGFYGRRFY